MHDFDLKLDGLPKDRLRALLVEVRDELRDVEDTFNFNIANTPGHIHEGMLHEHEEELYAYRERIEAIERLLAS